MIALKKRLFAGLLFAGLLAMPAGRAFALNARVASVSAGQSAEGDAEQGDEKDIYRKSSSVRKIGAMLGMNPGQSADVFEWVNFALLAGALGWFLVKALPKTFTERNTAIQKHLVDARTATEEANARLDGVEARLAKLDDEIAAMKAQAEKDAALDEARIKTAVEDETKKILEAAEQEIAAATTLARRQLQRYAAELAVEQAGRKLAITADTDSLLVREFARRLSEGNGGQN